MDDRIVIKGNRVGISAIINIDKFSGFEEMLENLIGKLSKGKRFYKNSTLVISTNLNSINAKDKENDKKMFSGVYEGKTKFLRKTVRSGQCINYNGNIVIIGDVNSGAEVMATGNVIVLGSIKGNVSAGVNGNTKAIVAAFSLQPETLKISNLVTFSPDSEKPTYPEVAKIKDGTIIVEPYIPNKYIY